MNFKIYLNGSDTKVRHESKEIQLLRGEAQFTTQQLADPRYKHLVDLNEEMKNWVSKEGMMVIAKGIIDGKLVNITNIDQLNSATNL
jgi:hypothetical protein